MSDFLNRPGTPGPFGALMDEYALAARGFCRALAGFSLAAYEAGTPSADPDTVSVRSIAEHVCRAAFGYARDLRKALDCEEEDDQAPPAEIRAPAEVPAILARALKHTERVGEALRHTPSKEVMANTFRMPWGQLYDPEILLEHAIVHLLRHRRQLERWC